MIEGVKARLEPRALRAPLLLALGMAACQSRALRDGPRADVADRPPASSAARAASARRPAPAPAPSASAARAPELEVASLPLPCGASDRAPTLAPGASVLVAPLRANYLPARVEAVEVDGSVRVKSWTGNSFTVEPDRVYPLDRPHPTAEVAGCYGGCKTGDLWVACRVLSGDERRVRVEDHAGVERSLPRADLVVFEPSLQRQVRTFLAEARYRDAFRAAVAAAGRPAVPAGYRPAVGEVVLVASGPRYLTAEVVAVTARTDPSAGSATRARLPRVRCRTWSRCRARRSTGDRRRRPATSCWRRRARTMGSTGSRSPPRAGSRIRAGRRGRASSGSRTASSRSARPASSCSGIATAVAGRSARRRRSGTGADRAAPAAGWAP